MEGKAWPTSPVFPTGCYNSWAMQRLSRLLEGQQGLMWSSVYTSSGSPCVGAVPLTERLKMVILCGLWSTYPMTKKNVFGLPIPWHWQLAGARFISDWVAIASGNKPGNDLYHSELSLKNICLARFKCPISVIWDAQCHKVGGGIPTPEGPELNVISFTLSIWFQAILWDREHLGHLHEWFTPGSEQGKFNPVHPLDISVAFDTINHAGSVSQGLGRSWLTDPPKWRTETSVWDPDRWCLRCCRVVFWSSFWLTNTWNCWVSSWVYMNDTQFHLSDR